MSNVLSFTSVFIGGGAEAGAWAAELVERGAAAGAAIVSDQPPDAPPYDRSRGFTRALLQPQNSKCRRFDGLPFCSYTVSYLLSSFKFHAEYSMILFHR